LQPVSKVVKVNYPVTKTVSAFAKRNNYLFRAFRDPNQHPPSSQAFQLEDEDDVFDQKNEESESQTNTFDSIQELLEGPALVPEKVKPTFDSRERFIDPPPIWPECGTYNPRYDLVQRRSSLVKFSAKKFPIQRRIS
jgi:hypothetical protein